MQEKTNIKKEYNTLLSQIKNVTLLILIVLDLIFIVLSVVCSFDIKTEQLLAIFDLIVCILIFIDLLYGYMTSNKGLYEYFITDKNIITILSILPLDLLVFRYFMIFKLIKFIQILSVVRVWHLKDNSALRFFLSHRLFNVLFIIFIVYTLLSSLLLLIFDPSFTNLGDGIWFTIITSTTVGYGDITPTSVLGRAISILTIIVGVIFVSVFTAYLTNVYDEQLENKTRHDIQIFMKKNSEEIKDLKKQINELEEKIDKLIEKEE